jgi:hypothetical protein
MAWLIEAVMFFNALSVCYFQFKNTQQFEELRKNNDRWSSINDRLDCIEIILIELTKKN